MPAPSDLDYSDPRLADARPVQGGEFAPNLSNRHMVDEGGYSANSQDSASQVQDEDIRTHQLLTRALMKQGHPEDTARRTAANLMTDPALEQLLRRRDQIQAANMAGSQEALLQRRDRYQARLMDQARAEQQAMLQRRDQYIAQRQQMARQMAAQTGGAAMSPRETQALQQLMAPQQVDPRQQFMQATAPVAAGLVKRMGMDPGSAAIIAAQLFGVHQSNQPSDTEIAGGVNQALSSFLSPPPRGDR